MSLTNDFGVRGRRAGPPVARMALVIGAPLLLATIATGWFLHRQNAVANARAWTISGPPCPSLTAAAYQSSPTPVTRAFDYDGVVFARASAEVSCNEVVKDAGRGWGRFPVCQFNSPGMLKITTSRGDFFFAVSGGPATVSVRDGQPVCMRNSNFHGEPNLTPDAAIAVEH